MKEAIAEARKAIELDPNGAQGYESLAEVLVFGGKPGEALAHVRRAMRLDPQGGFIPLWTLGHAHYLLRQYDEAIDALKRALVHNPHFLPAHVVLTVIYSEQGRRMEAALSEREVVERAKSRADMDRWAERLPYRDEAPRRRLVEAFDQEG